MGSGAGDRQMGLFDHHGFTSPAFTLMYTDWKIQSAQAAGGLEQSAVYLEGTESAGKPNNI